MAPGAREKCVMKIFVLHENAAWVEPLRKALAERSLPFEEWFLDEGRVDLASAPPAGVFYNRMSASSHKNIRREPFDSSPTKPPHGNPTKNVLREFPGPRNPPNIMRSREWDKALMRL